MKKLIALLLCLVTTVSLLAACGGKSDPSKSSVENSTTSSPEEPAGTTPDASSSSEGYVDNFVYEDDMSDVPEIRNHEMLPEDQIPSQFTLIGTKHLPPISNQGSLGTCASQAITYEQFTNAVSRYIESVDPSTGWNPSSGNESQIFAPKFTYNFSSAGTVWVYNILMDHGASPLENCKFYQTASGTITGDSVYNRQPQTIAWPVENGVMDNALNYRLLNYQQIWTREVGNKFTTSDSGKELLYKIKDAVAQGNVVVTGGFSSSWQYINLSRADAKSSTLANTGDMVAVWCNGTKGGHQVSIVGYDDNLTVNFNGVTMKGAFLVANSWGTGWGNKGYFWVMYDSINLVSEFEEMNMKDRQVSLDQFCFIYWETDIVVGKPCAYVTAEVEIKDREGFYLELTRTDKTDTMSSYVPHMFVYGTNFENIHSYSFLKTEERYATFFGNVDSDAEVGYITLSYSNLVPQGSKFEDYTWGINVHGASENVKINKLTLFDGQGKQRGEIIPSADIATVSSGRNQIYVFDMGQQLNSSHDIGSYKLKNAASGLYCKVNVMPLESCESVLDASIFDVEFDYIGRKHIIRMNGKQYVLDIAGKTVKDGVAVKFNAENITRNTQDWLVVKLADGSYNIRLACDTKYAVGMKDGAIVLVSGADIRDYGSWILENPGSDLVTSTVRYNESGELMAEGRIPAGMKADQITVTVYTSSGTKVNSFTVTGSGDNRTYSEKVEGLSAGAYVFTFADEKGNLVSANYYVLVK